MGREGGFLLPEGHFGGLGWVVGWIGRLESLMGLR